MTSILPVSDHCDGTLFFNPGTQPPPHRPSPLRVMLAMLRWRFGSGRRERARWPDWVEDPAPTGDPAAEPPAGGLSLTFIGHSSFHLRAGGHSVLIDPVFSARCSPVSWAGPKRVRAPGRALDALPAVDLVLVTHNHYDHMDLPSLRRIVRRDDPLFITPLGNARHLRKAGARRIVELDWWQAHVLPDGTRITATPARHFSARTLRDRRRSLWAGFMLELGSLRVFHAGDSGDGPHWREIGQRLGPPDLAMLPIGAYQPRALMRAVHVDPAEAVAAHKALGARRSVGMHFGTFQLTDEPIDQPEARLAAEAAAAGLSGGAFTTLGFGETRSFEGSS